MFALVDLQKPQSKADVKFDTVTVRLGWPTGTIFFFACEYNILFHEPLSYVPEKNTCHSCKHLVLHSELHPEKQ